MEVITVDFIDVSPREIEDRKRPEEKLNADKNAQKPVDSAGKILIVFSQGNKKLSYWLLDPGFGDHML